MQDGACALSFLRPGNAVFLAHDALFGSFYEGLSLSLKLLSH